MSSSVETQGDQKLTTYASRPAECSTSSSVIRCNTGIHPKKLSGSSGSREAAHRCRLRAAYSSVHLGRNIYRRSDDSEKYNEDIRASKLTQNVMNAPRPSAKLITNCVYRSRCSLVGSVNFRCPFPSSGLSFSAVHSAVAADVVKDIVSFEEALRLSGCGEVE